MTSRLIDRLWATGTPEALFGSPLAVIPWPRAPRTKGRPIVDRAVLAEVLRAPPRLAEVDPRTLHGTQSHVVAHHVHYYLGIRWELTGEPAADRDQPANAFPLIYTDEHGRQVILGGHHRAAAALLQGRPLWARTIPAPDTDAVAVLPGLHLGTAAAVTTTPPAATVSGIADQLARRHAVLVQDPKMATLIKASLASDDLGVESCQGGLVDSSVRGRRRDGHE